MVDRLVRNALKLADKAFADEARAGIPTADAATQPNTEIPITTVW